MNKVELEKKIKELDGLTNEEKSELLGLLRKQKKYGLVWEDKPEDVEERLRDELPVVIEDTSKAIISDDTDAPNHILIEGDNLEALTALAYTHEGKIDVIYIDPPYNTGNKDFVYNDRFVDREDSYRHSKWLSFMNKRLRIAKQLLSDNGKIFISIDENESSQLKLLCDEIFNENNFIGSLVWESTTQPINAGKAKFQLQQKTEEILCYTKKAENKYFALEIDTTQSPKYPHGGKLGKCRFEIIEKSDAGQYKRETMKFAILGQLPREGKRWQIGEDTAKWLIEHDRIEIIDGLVKKAVYPEDEEDKVKYIPFWSLFSAKDFGSALSAKDELNTLMGKAVGFDTVKPIALISKLFSYFHKDITILDFFAGSGTTLHATMELNKDGGKRKCILVTNNENNICEEVTYERNKRVINGYTNAKGEEVVGLTANNLRYYKTDFISRKRTIKNMRALVTASTDLLCIKNNIYAEQSTFAGRKLKPEVARYFENDKTKMLIIYNELAVDAFAKLLRTMDIDGKIKVYVFSNNRYAYNDNFEEVLDKVELCALPAAIYDAYNAVLKPYRKEETDNNVVFEDDSTEFTNEQGMINFNEEGGVQ